MNNMQIFQNEEFGTVRTLMIEGEPWFVGRDVTGILGYRNPQEAIRTHVSEEDKRVNEILTPGGVQTAHIINESGLYSLIITSRLPAAKRFKRWVTAEILPSIRKHAIYAVDELIANPDLAIAALQALKAERETSARLAEQVASQKMQLAEMRPKASYCDLVLSCRDALPITVIAKDYGWTPQQMNRFLHSQHVQYRVGRTWVLYDGYAGLGYTKTRTLPYEDPDGTPHSAVHTRWTQKGRLFVYDLMKAAGNLPLLEQEDCPEPQNGKENDNG